METSRTIVQQGTARARLLRPDTLLVSRYYLARSLLSFINAVLNAPSNPLKKQPRFNLLERAMIGRLQKVPM